jgi:hypothetical protein
VTCAREQLERLTQPVRVDPLPAGAGGGVLALGPRCDRILS